jgi:hypothetical protein
VVQIAPCPPTSMSFQHEFIQACAACEHTQFDVVSII